jgi:hypothetical protein
MGVELDLSSEEDSRGARTGMAALILDRQPPENPRT